jgi:uncharacterized protein (DUF697 family)
MLARSREVWKLVRELDLESIRGEAESRFRLAVAAEPETLASDVARLLSGNVQGPAHPWIDIVTTGQQTDAGERGASALIVVSRTAELSEPTAATRARFVQAGRVVVVAVVGPSAPTDTVPRGGEAGRVGIARLDQEAADRIAGALVEFVPALPELALARQLPPFRRPVLTRLVERTSKANATYALTTALAETVPIVSAPLAFGDMVVLTKNQLIMAYKIALGAGRTGRPRDLLGEIVSVIGTGFLFRQGARSLVGLLPVIGIVPKVTVAYAGTWAIGRAIMGWALHGQRFSARRVSGFYRDARRRGRKLADRLVQQHRSPPADSARPGPD